MQKIDPIFKDSELQKQFDINGYVKIKLIDLKKTKQLYDFYLLHQNEHDAIEGRYKSTTHTNNPKLILKINRLINSVLITELDKYFQNYEPMMCTYITKQPGEGSETRLHQDPTFVDEKKYVSANIWVALHNINHQNGNLFFVNGTHRFMPSLRVTPDCPTAYDKVKDLLLDNLTEVPVEAGEAIVINHAVMHGATPNFSKGLRIAAVMAIRSKSSHWIYHYLQQGEAYNKIEKYNVNLETFITLQKDGRPSKENFAGYINWDFPQIERSEFQKKINESKSLGLNSNWKNKLALITEKLFPKV